MKNLTHISYWQILLALAACCAFVLVWSLPVLVMGDGFGFFPHLEARNFAETGMFSFTGNFGRLLSTNIIPGIGTPSASDGRLSRVLVALLSQGIAWDDLVGWTMAGATVLAIGMLCWWSVVYRLFDRRTAWVTLFITALMPVYFREAVWFDNYNLALACLAASGAAYVWLKDKRMTVALLIAGLLFGASCSAKDVFLIMIPWIGVTFLWKKQWKGGAVFFIAAAAVYMVPYMSDIATLGYPVNQNLARLWPGAETIANETYLHLYPDPYTYHFDRAAFDEQFIAAVETKSLSDRMRDEKVMMSYGLADGIFRRVRLGTWLILHDIPSFFQRQTVGGVFLWIFALPGIVLLWRREKALVLWLLGLVVSMYIAIRFVLMYEREHFMNIAWIYALFVGYGITEISAMQRHVRVGLATVLLTALCCLQLLQANRYEVAAWYNKSNVAELRGAAETLRGLPEDAVIALDIHPSSVESLALLSDRTLLLFDTETVERLRSAGTLKSVFTRYGVTHALDYTMQTPARNVASSSVVSPPPSAMTKWLIHLIR
jgi:hypothetical protein